MKLFRITKRETKLNFIIDAFILLYSYASNLIIVMVLVHIVAKHVDYLVARIQNFITLVWAS